MNSISQPMLKMVVCHRGSGDYYEASVALVQAGLRETMVTDIYLSPKSLSFSKSLTGVIPNFSTVSSRIAPQSATNYKKESSLVVGKKPYGKSRFTCSR